MKSNKVNGGDIVILTSLRAGIVEALVGDEIRGRLLNSEDRFEVYDVIATYRQVHEERIR